VGASLVTTHTGDLNLALAEALRHSLATHADSVHVEVLDRAEDRTPLLYLVSVWKDLNYWTAEHANPVTALNAAMVELRAATGEEASDGR
jgi:hypothetical protein